MATGTTAWLRLEDVAVPLQTAKSVLKDFDVRKLSAPDKRQMAAECTVTDMALASEGQRSTDTQLWAGWKTV